MYVSNVTQPRNAQVPWAFGIAESVEVDKEVERGRDDDLVFYLVASASFVESSSDDYKNNLLAFFHGDKVVEHWLSTVWVHDEIRHGQALRRYVEAVWPEFDWAASYEAFHRDSRRYCTVRPHAKTRALELASMCLVETGTSTLYRALAGLANGPVLRRLATAISDDEVRHYKFFYSAFLRYRTEEKPCRFTLLSALANTRYEVERTNVYYAYKSVFCTHNPGRAFEKCDYAAIRARTRKAAKRYYPYRMATKMFLKPLGLPPVATRLAVPAMSAAARFFFLR